MVTSCFFCQNVLSDYIEGVLAASREAEIKKHLGDCSSCTEVHRDLTTTLDILHSLPPRTLSTDMALQISQASAPGKTRFLTAARISRAMLVLAVPLLLFGGAVVAFPRLFPWFTQWRQSSDDTHFARYFPLLQGATEIVDEQSNWLHVREPFMRSVWEEGGLSPEEFEKTFQGKGAKSDPNESRSSAD